MERLTAWDRGSAYYPKCFEPPCEGIGCNNEQCEFRYEICKRLAAYEDTEQNKHRWIPISERLPECEKEVEVTVERRYENKEHHSTCRAIYENGNMHISESIFNWYDFDIEDERVPEGWFEAVSYAEEFHTIDDFVIAWRPLPKPYQPN